LQPILSSLLDATIIQSKDTVYREKDEQNRQGHKSLCVMSSGHL
jgi:hypothetical protein